LFLRVLRYPVRLNALYCGRSECFRKLPGASVLRSVMHLAPVVPQASTATHVRGMLTAPNATSNEAYVDPRALLEANIDLINRAVTFACRRNRFTPDDTDDFRGIVHLRLVENDFGILRKFEGRSTLSAYIATIIQRMILDYRNQKWGKWRNSAEAKRLGAVAITAETELLRDHRTTDEVFATLRHRFPSVTKEEFHQILTALPRRTPRPRVVGLDEAASLSVACEDYLHEENAAVARQVSAVVREYICGIDREAALILRLRFDSEMTVAEIARSLAHDQRALYRIIEAHLRHLRELLQRRGINATTIGELIEGGEVEFSFLQSTPEAES